MNTVCFPFDPVDRIATEISNLKSCGWPRRKIRNHMFSRWLHYYDIGHYQGSAQESWSRLWKMIELHNNPNFDGYWSDCLAWYHTDEKEAGHYYETVLYPSITEQCHLLDRLAFGGEPVRTAYV